MDESEIRMWAWEETTVSKGALLPDGSYLNWITRLSAADKLAAWVMSGKLPQVEEQA